MKKKKGSKNTVRRARLLENGIQALRLRGFHVVAGKQEFKRYCKKHPILPDRYIITPFEHDTLYGTPGRKESFIHCALAGDFIFEAKYQNGSGSADEKAAYLWESFLVSPIRNWIVWFDGNWFQKDKRGLAIVSWLRNQIQSRPVQGREFYVVNSDKEFYTLVGQLFEHQEQKPQPANQPGDLFQCMD